MMDTKQSKTVKRAWRKTHHGVKNVRKARANRRRLIEADEPSPKAIEKANEALAEAKAAMTPTVPLKVWARTQDELATREWLAAK